MSSAKPFYSMVTGGAGDIGGAIAAKLSAAGHETLIVDTISDVAGAARARQLTVEGPIRYFKADTTSAHELDNAIRSLDGLDLAVMCAGIVSAQPFLSIDETAWRSQLEVNLTGSFLASQRAARRMVAEHTRGHLVFVSSWVAQRPWPEISAYSVSKAGVDQLMRQAALELSSHGIRANAVAPGIVMAGLAKKQFEEEPQYAERASRSIPLGSPQSPEDVASIVAFLAGPEASAITGSVFLVDGGSSLGTLN